MAVYNALWFAVPFAALALAILRPGRGPEYLERATSWGRQHEQGLVVVTLTAARRLPHGQGRGAALLAHSIAAMAFANGEPHPVARSKPGRAGQHEPPNSALLPVVMSRNAPGLRFAIE